MSIMSDLADEVLKPVKLGLFITSAVVVVGGIAVAANSKKGRAFLSKVKDAALVTKPEDTKKLDKEEVVIDVVAEENNSVADLPLAEPQKLIGENNV